MNVWHIRCVPPTGSNYVYMKTYVTVFAFIYYTIRRRSLENNKLSFYSLVDSSVDSPVNFFPLGAAIRAVFNVLHKVFPMAMEGFNWPASSRLSARIGRLNSPGNLYAILDSVTLYD